MTNLLKIAYYELNRLLRDWRLIVIVLSQPIVIAIIVSLIASHSPTNLKVGVVNEKPGAYSNLLVEKISQASDISTVNYSAVDPNEVKAGKMRAFVVINIPNDTPDKGEVTILNDASGQYVKLIIQPKILQAVSDVSKQISQDSLQTKLPTIKFTQTQFSPISTETRDISNLNIKFSDYYGSAMMVLLILLVVVNLSGMSVTGERVNGTFERLFVTPYSKSDVIFGKAIALFSVGVIIALLGNLTLILFFNAVIGSVGLTILINTLVVAVSVALGLLVSSITRTVVESVQLSMYLFFISVLTSSIFSPIETINKYFAYVVKIVPFYYAVDALRKVNMSGADFSQVARNIYILAGSFLIFIIASVILLRRETS